LFKNGWSLLKVFIQILPFFKVEFAFFQKVSKQSFLKAIYVEAFLAKKSEVGTLRNKIIDSKND